METPLKNPLVGHDGARLMRHAEVSVSPDELWAILEATNPDGPDDFRRAVGADAPHTLQSLILLLEDLPLTERESALVALVLSCVHASVDAALPATTLIQ